MKLVASTLVLFASSALIAQAPTPEQQEAIRLYAAAKPYMDLPVSQIKASLPVLEGLKPDDSQQADLLLQKAGDIVAAQIPRIPNLVAREDVADEQPARPLVSDYRRITVSPGAALVPTNWRHFEYIIRTVNRPPDVTEFVESRKDSAQKPVETNLHGTGFGALWLIFIPSNLPHSSFRYLGRQKVNGVQAYVVAFAEDPEKIAYPGVVDDPSGKIPMLQQGLAWIDPDSFRIVRIRTDLLMPLPQIQLDNISSTVDFSEVKIPNFPEVLWLPRRVEITWKSHNISAGELHQYSDYRLFHSTVRILPD